MLTTDEIKTQLRNSNKQILVDKNTNKQFSFEEYTNNHKSRLLVYYDKKKGTEIVKRVLLREFLPSQYRKHLVICLANTINYYLKDQKKNTL